MHGFNTVASHSPIIDSNPTEMVNCKATAKVLGQDYSVQTMDQQLYAIAQQVKWACPESFLSHHNRLVGFHTICCFVGCIGKLWGDGGLTDLLKDSNVYASCTVDSLLDGRQFHRSIRELTLVYEALMSTLLQTFLEISDGREVLTSEGQETLNTMYSSLT